MGKVAVDTSISLDGFITGPNPRPDAGLGAGGERIFEWMMTATADGEPSRELGEAWDQLFGEPFSSTGAVIMGRNMFDIIDSPNGWVAPDGTAFTWPCFVLTHHPLEDGVKGQTPFTFVCDGIETREIDWVVPGSVRSVRITDPEGNRIQLGQVLGNDT